MSKPVTNIAEFLSKIGVTAIKAPETDVDPDQHEQIAYNEKIDIWGIGVTFYSLLSNELTPFTSKKNKAFEKK